MSLKVLLNIQHVDFFTHWLVVKAEVLVSRQGPVCSADLFCRERLSRPMTQLYGRHSSVGLPESDLLTWVSFFVIWHS